MADYKNMITGTLKSVFGKVKEVAASEPVQNLVDKVKDVADSDKVQNIVNKVVSATEGTAVREICEQGAGVAKTYGSIAKLSLEIAGDKEELKRVYSEIGELYYEQAKDAPEGFFTALFAQAAAIKKDIAEREEYIATLKTEVAPADADIDVEIAEFEEVVEETAAEGAGIVVEEAPVVEEVVVEEAPADETPAEPEA